MYWFDWLIIVKFDWLIDVQVVGVRSGTETAKCKQVYCDPTYVTWVKNQLISPYF